MWGDRVHEGFPCRGVQTPVASPTEVREGGNWLTPFRTRSGHMRRGAEQPRETDSPPGRRRSAAPVPVTERFGLKVADAIRGTRKRSRHIQFDRSLCAPYVLRCTLSPERDQSLIFGVWHWSGAVASVLLLFPVPSRRVEFSLLEQGSHTSKISNSR